MGANIRCFKVTSLQSGDVIHIIVIFWNLHFLAFCALIIFGLLNDCGALIQIADRGYNNVRKDTSMLLKCLLHENN